MIRRLEMPKKCISKTSKILLRFTPKPLHAQVKFFFTVRCPVDTESSDIETTNIASVVIAVINFGHLSGRL